MGKLVQFPTEKNLTMGMMASELEESHRAKIGEILTRFGHLPEYWILLTCKWEGSELHRRFLVFNTPPVIKKYLGERVLALPFLATICYYRNNSWPDREVKRIWALTHDFPIPDEFFIDGEDASPHPSDDAWRLGVPMIY